ncbi:unnamed protein product [Echinostoma caproni]|uniref:DUF4913 domain-containing protein n=1 Tax=Echinostoma caproni TaxID=27848 RepID=A0A182ZZL9_9TREM|nr:unnamed protein product [Echinostoma caproni]
MDNISASFVSNQTGQDTCTAFGPPELVCLYKRTTPEEIEVSDMEWWIRNLHICLSDWFAFADLPRSDQEQGSQVRPDSPLYPIPIPPSDDQEVHAASVSHRSSIELPPQSRWQRVKEYLMSAKSAEPVITV